MKFMKRIFILGTVLFLVSCGVQNNVTFFTENGTCANGTLNAPYCMAVTVQNNTTGQNFINSSNFPLNDVQVTVSGANNIISPMTNVPATDPNGCTSNTIGSGESCTFYLQIANESYPVASIEPINVSISYTVNNNLFGGNDATYTAGTTIFERTNLYALNTNGQLWTYNDTGLKYSGLAESSNITGGGLLSSSVDTFVYGNLFLSNSNAIWRYGNGVIGGNSNTPSGLNGSNLMFNLSSGVYASSYTTGNMWNLPIESGGTWTNSALPATSSHINANTYAISPSGSLYLANGYTAFNCSGIITSSSSAGCPTEATGFPITDSITGMGYAGILYAGSTTNGLWYESGTGPTATWLPFSGAGISPSAAITTLKTTANNGYIILSDSNSNIWAVNQLQSIAQITTTPSAAGALAIDNIATNIYYTAGGSLYSCGSGGFLNCSPVLISPVSTGSGLTGTMQNLLIGSSLSN